MTGCCLCESIRFEVRGALGPVRYCHRTRCRRATGSAFSTNAEAAKATSCRLGSGSAR